MIHQSAIIDTSADLAPDIEVGPFTIIGPDVVIDKGCVIGPHVVINGPTEIGKNNRIFQFCSIGEAPQDLKYNNEPTKLIIGDHNTFREYVTVNRGTVSGHGETVIGNNGLFMAYVHIAHDCIIKDNVIFSNAVSLAGHVTINNNVTLGGFTLVHQFIHIGEHAFTGMGTALNRDLPPYMLVYGNYARAIGINKEGLKRRGFSPESISALSQSFKALIKSRNRSEGMEIVRPLAEQFTEVKKFMNFIESSERGVVR
ncbi:MAG TPA: acyl-ACP--UDP-N-acetylglucosamine O-acyltransferase [Chromatiales bacterium]|nr:acyl-ACP--UDP-N-acetylglucosamine O-acyltransferase [Thiotrichales bacterium]HIP67121.1 acyl-ACP--UDP-N-acetylglucosamine O-acyltransferase [Chromatiales bacterium]